MIIWNSEYKTFGETFCQKWFAVFLVCKDEILNYLEVLALYTGTFTFRNVNELTFPNFIDSA